MKYIDIMLLLLLTSAINAECIDNKTEINSIEQLKIALLCIQGENIELTEENKSTLNSQTILEKEVGKLQSELSVAMEKLNKQDDFLKVTNNNSKELRDLKDKVSNNRDSLSKLNKDNKNNISSFKKSCNKNKLIKESKRFRASVEEFSKKGKTVNISIVIKNKTRKDIQTSFYNEYAILTSPSGEVQYKSTGSINRLIRAEDSEAFASNFVLKKDYEGNSFDFILKFDKPSLDFAFSGITTACFQ